jgi:hypothetical protein
VGAARCDALKVNGGLTVAERAHEPARLGAVQHDRQRIAVFERAESDERGRSGRAYVRAVLVGVDDERGPELRREGGEGASCLGSLLERAWVVAEEEVDLAATGEALHGRAFTRGGAVPVATGLPRSDGKRAAVGETAQAAEPEACPGRQVVETETERDGAGDRAAGLGLRERLGVVVVSVHEQELEAGPAELGFGGAEEAAPFRVTRQVAEVAQGEERVAALLDCPLDQAAQPASVAVQVAKDEQTTQSSRAYRGRAQDPGRRQPGPALLVAIEAEGYPGLGMMPLAGRGAESSYGAIVCIARACARGGSPAAAAAASWATGP